MPKTGRERKAKRRARQQAERQLVRAVGDHWAADTPADEKRNLYLVRRAMRWRTDVGGERFDPIDSKQLSLNDIAVLVSRRCMLSQSSDVQLVAVRVVIAMEAQNQKDEQARVAALWHKRGQ